MSIITKKSKRQKRQRQKVYAEQVGRRFDDWQEFKGDKALQAQAWKDLIAYQTEREWVECRKTYRKHAAPKQEQLKETK